MYTSDVELQGMFPSIRQIVGHGNTIVEIEVHGHGSEYLHKAPSQVESR
jgi:hypothetical protein